MSEVSSARLAGLAYVLYFLVAIGMSTVIGMAFIVGGLGWRSLAIPRFPAALGSVVYGIGGVAELALATWLLVRG